MGEWYQSLNLLLSKVLGLFLSIKSTLYNTTLGNSCRSFHSQSSAFMKHSVYPPTPGNGVEDDEIEDDKGSSSNEEQVMSDIASGLNPSWESQITSASNYSPGTAVTVLFVCLKCFKLPTK